MSILRHKSTVTIAVLRREGGNTSRMQPITIIQKIAMYKSMYRTLRPNNLFTNAIFHMNKCSIREEKKRSASEN